jgi:hypothetical protein
MQPLFANNVQDFSCEIRVFVGQQTRVSVLRGHNIGLFNITSATLTQHTQTRIHTERVYNTKVAIFEPIFQPIFQNEAQRAHDSSTTARPTKNVKIKRDRHRR